MSLGRRRMWRSRRSRSRRHRIWEGVHSRRRRRLIWAGVGFGTFLSFGLAVVGAVALRDLHTARTALTATRARLEAAISDPGALASPEGRDRTRASMQEALNLLGQARTRVASSQTLRVLALLPGLRTQRSGVLTLIDDGAAATKSGDDLLGRLQELAANGQLRQGHVPLPALVELETELRATASRLEPLRRSSAGLWGPLGDARHQFDDLVSSSVSRLTQGSDALVAARGFVGEAGFRRYLVAVQNNAEMRDQGMVLSYVVITFDRGRLALERNGPIVDLALAKPSPTPVPPGTSEVFGFIQPTQFWHSVNATADFAFSGRAMVDMYRQATGTAIDGIIAVDVPGLAALLTVLGPVQVPGIAEPVTAENAGRVLLHDLYEGIPPSTDPSGRKERLSELTRTVVNRLLEGVFDTVAVGRQLGFAAEGGHLRLWSAVEVEEDIFESTGLGGGPDREQADRTFHVAVQNRTATKLDYYVKPTVRQEVRLTKDGDAVVRTTVALRNEAPVDGQPSYQLGPDEFMSGPGEYMGWLLLWGPAGSRQAGAIAESGLALSQHVIGVGPGQTREVAFETVVPRAVRDGRLSLRLVPQSRLEPVPLEVQLEADGWRVKGPKSWKGPWDRTRTVSWEVARR